MPFELSWIPEGSVGFLINLFGFFELTMVVVRGREVFFAHCLDCGQCLGGIVPNMFLEGQASIEVEAQVSPVCLGFESRSTNS